MKPTSPDSSVTMRRQSTSSVRRQSIVEAAEAHLDKNTIILCGGFSKHLKIISTIGLENKAEDRSKTTKLKNNHLISSERLNSDCLDGNSLHGRNFRNERWWNTWS